MQAKTTVFCIVSAILAGCSGKTEINVEPFSYSDSTEYAKISIEGELPTADDEVTQAIHDTLLYILEEQMCFTDYEGNKSLEQFSGDRTDLAKLINYYGDGLSEVLSGMCKTDVDYRDNNIRQNDMLSEDEKQQMLSDIPSWDYSVSLRLDTVTSKYAVFQNYTYLYQGGAHGGVAGAGTITFDMKTGKRFTNFFDRGDTHRMQKLLRNGLIAYFNECGDEVTDENLNDHLQVSRNIVPLPYAYAPYPSEDGLVFTYAQYEIACYAAGMPTFTVPYHDLLPYLTDEAKELLSDKIEE